jgi:hypothetical protein
MIDILVSPNSLRRSLTTALREFPSKQLPPRRKRQTAEIRFPLPWISAFRSQIARFARLWRIGAYASIEKSTFPERDSVATATTLQLVVLVPG